MKNKTKLRSEDLIVDPFGTHGDVSESACIDNYIGLDQLSDDYAVSANTLVAHALQDHNYLDGHIYAICFLYRHSMELFLKDMIWKSHYILTGEKRFLAKDWRELKKHKLINLWSRCLSDAGNALSGDWPLSQQEQNTIAYLIEQFETHDPDSFSFRYPFGQKTGRTHKTLNHVNIRVLRDKMQEVRISLSAVRERINYGLEHVGWC